MPRISPNRIKNFLAFNGSSDFLTLPITPSVTGFNLAFWAIKRNHVGNARIIDCQDGGPSNGFTIVEENAGLPQASAVTNNGADTARIIKSIPNGRLFHMAVTHNGTELNVYINGVLAGTDTSAVYTATGQVLTIGRRAPSTLNYWNGKLGELIFHSTSTPWTQYQITNLYHNGIIPSGASYWLFNGNVLDGSGNGNHGTLTGGTYVYQNSGRIVPRLMGGSTSFNGTTSKIDCGATDIIGTGNVTTSAWIKPSGWGELTGRILDNGKFFFRVSNTSGQKSILVASDGANATCGSANSSILLGKWQHVIATRTSAGVCNVYINGALSGTANQDSGTPAAATTNTIIGNDTAAGKTFDGKIAEVKIFNSVLTASQAAELYSTGSVSGISPVASYALDNQPSTYIDSIAGNNGTGTATTYSTDTPVQQRVVVSNDKASLKFNGTSAKIDSNFVGITGSMTFVGKLKRIVNTGNHAIFGGSVANNIIIRCVSGTNTLQFYAKSSTTSITFANAIPLNKWFRFALSYDGATAKLYINGQLFGSIAYTETWNPSPNTLVIGSRDGTDFFNGNIESIQIFNRILTLEEIKNIHFNNILPTSGIALNLPLNEGSGTTAYDSSGNGNNGTITGATWSSDTPSNKRKAVGENLVVNGDFSYVPVVNVATTTTNKFIDGTSGGASNNIFGWSFSKVGTASALFDVTNLSPSGKPSLKLSTLAVASLSAAYIPLKGFSVATNDNGVLSIPVTPNTSYTLSFLMKTNLVSGVSDDGAGILCSCSTGGGGATFSAYPISIFGTSGWTLYTDTFTTSATSRSIQVSPRIEGRTGTGTLIMDAWFADIKLQKTTPPVRSNPA